MRSYEEHRQQNISQESLRQREAVKPSGYAGAPSSSSAQVAPSSRKAENNYLKARVIVKHKLEETEIGVPQGVNLSPILSNIMLNELDKELEKRGHRFVRYADDLLIF